MVDKNSQLWGYLSKGQRDLVETSLFLLEDIQSHPDSRVLDYSYVVFPIAKAYEGFLKQLFLDRGYININQYNSIHFRIGKALSPTLTSHFKGRSVYFQITTQCGKELADMFWQMWKKGRNVLFHYFPHNLQSISLQEAKVLVYDFISVMEKGMYECKTD